MANQQEENYTKIGNEILEYIPKVKLNGTQRGIITVIWRYTFGFHRDDHDFSLGFLSDATNCDRQQVKRELDKLITDKVLRITKEADFNNSRRIAFNKDFSQWDVKGIVSAKKSTVSELAYTTVSGLADTTVSGLAYQERKTKEILKKDVESYETIFEELWKLYPSKKGKSAVKKSQRQRLGKIGFEILQGAIEAYKNEIKVRAIKPEYILNGSTFFNGRYNDYLNDEEEEPEKIDLNPKPNDFSKWTE